jgi:hypothetical protein
MSFNYLTIGSGCSPAAALRDLNLREFALPFDWVVSNINTIQKCIETNFEYFHKNLVLNNNKTRLIDYYGFEFPHDYPLSDMNNVENNIVNLYVEKIKHHFFQEENLRLIMSKRACETIKTNFDLKKMIKSYTDLYTKI